MLASDIIKRYCVRQGGKFRLADIDPADRCGLDVEKDEAKVLLAEGTKRLGVLQERLYAEHRWAILVSLQGLDAAGKAAVVLPRRGHIGIFNRSYYEEVLVVRLHKELLEHQGLPPKLLTKDIWRERFEDINAFELHLARNGIVPMKFFLHISRKEQQKRLLERLDDPAKQWKFNAADVGESKLWDRYMEAYDDMVRQTATDDAPWHVVPADHKWFARLVVAAAIVARLEAIDPRFPTLDEAALRQLAAVRASLTEG
jgi:polyphosphate kinase 2 (PPK2 family)